MKKIITSALLVVLDLLFLLFLFFVINNIIFNQEISSKIILIFVFILSLLFIGKIYINNFDFWEETKVILKSILLSFLILSTFYLFDFYLSKDIFICYFIVLILLFPIYKRIIKRVVYIFDFFKTRVKIIGNEEQKNKFEKEFLLNWYLGFKVVKDNPEVIFVASKDVPIKSIEAYIRRYSKFIRDIYLLPYMENINFSQSEILEYFNIRASAIKMQNNLLKPINLFIKNLFEKFLVLLIVPFLLILHLVIVCLIKRDSSGKVFFKQKRLGKNGKIFECYKYRTMYENGDSILQEYLEKNKFEKLYYDKYHKYKNDPRITNVGYFLRKTSLDEIPQIINVIKGEMNLIGPRPYMPNEEHKMKKEINMILRAKPGISGLWQVSGRNELTFDERKKLDVWYIQNWSLWMDIIIFFKTLKVVVSRKGAR
ncbi:sugar transferase [Sulfurospirillum sp. 1307]